MHLVTGAGAFFRGLGFVVSTPRVWPRAAVPVLVALVLFGGLATLGIWAAAQRTDGVVFALLAVAAVLLALLLALAVAQPLSGWALDGIVRAQRRALGLPELPPTSTVGAMASSLGAGLVALAIGMPVVALLTVIGWAVPGAALITVPLKVFVAALMVAWDLVDYPLAMQGHRLGDRFRWAGRNFGAFCGFGLAAVAFFSLPGLGLLALPFGVAGAARLTRSGT
jgi:CysZ protein